MTNQQNNFDGSIGRERALGLRFRWKAPEQINTALRTRRSAPFATCPFAIITAKETTCLRQREI